MIKSIHLERFKKFLNTEIVLNPFTVLMGENSSGKTTVLQAINFSLSVLATHDFISTENGHVRIRKKGVGLTTLPGINIADYKELYYGKIHRGGTAKGAEGSRIEVVDTDDNIYRLRITSLFGSYNVKCLSTNTDLNHSPSLQNKAPLFISGFVGLRLTEERAFPRTLQDRLRSGQVSTIIRNIILDTKKKSNEGYSRLKARLAKDFDFYLEDVNFDDENDLFVTAHYRDTCGKNSISLDFNSSGSGFMQILQIIAPIYLYCPHDVQIVLLDEPDAHLHPNLQHNLANTLREVQQELGIQIIISTHSTSIIRAADSSEIIPITSNSKINVPLTSRQDVENQIEARIDAYDLGKSIISGKLLFVEDHDTSILEEFDKVLGTKCFHGPNTIPVIAGKGKDDKAPFQLHDILLNYIHKSIDLYVLRDSDGLTKDWKTKLIGYGDKNHVNLKILDYYEIENYLLVPQLLRKALVMLVGDSQSPSTTEILNKLTELLRDSIRLAKANYSGNLEENLYKSGILIGDDSYRNFATCKSEASLIRDSYELCSSWEDLIIVGMGKETLRGFMKWVNEDLKIKFSIRDIFKVIEPEDIPEEMKVFLRSLVSNEAHSSPSELPLFDIVDEEDEKIKE